MTVYFVDTSALVKRYITEIGSTWVQTQMLADQENVVVICELATIEFFSALLRGSYVADRNCWR